MGPAEARAVPLQWQIVAVTLMLTLTCKAQTSPRFTSETNFWNQQLHENFS